MPPIRYSAIVEVKSSPPRILMSWVWEQESFLSGKVVKVEGALDCDNQLVRLLNLAPLDEENEIWLSRFDGLETFVVVFTPNGGTVGWAVAGDLSSTGGDAFELEALTESLAHGTSALCGVKNVKDVNRDHIASNRVKLSLLADEMISQTSVERFNFNVGISHVKANTS